MEKINQELDPITGVVTQHGFQDDKLVIHKRADLTPNLEYATALRNSDEYSAQGIKRGFFHVAHVDEISQVELLKIGIDIFRATPRQIVAGLKRIGRDHFITTRKQI
jgi:hypothetical protein